MMSCLLLNSKDIGLDVVFEGAELMSGRADEPRLNEPVRQNGWVNDARGVKYRRMVESCVEGDVVVSWRITSGISRTMVE